MLFRSDDGKRPRPPRFNHDRAAVFEAPHVQLARRNPLIRPVRPPVNDERAHAADALATIMIKRNRLLAFADQPLIEHVEHLQKRHLRADVGDLVLLEFPLAGRVGLSPDLERKLHSSVEVTRT